MMLNIASFRGRCRYGHVIASRRCSTVQWRSVVWFSEIIITQAGRILGRNTSTASPTGCGDELRHVIEITRTHFEFGIFVTRIVAQFSFRMVRGVIVGELEALRTFQQADFAAGGAVF